MDWLQFWELLSYLVTVFGLPFAIAVFIYEQRRERNGDDEEAYQVLANAYTDFLKVVLAHSDLRLRSAERCTDLTPEQLERRRVIYDMLISLFERAYLLAYEEDMSPTEARRWNSWEDYMREWCRRADFASVLPDLLRGEDEEFAAYIRRLESEERAKLAAR
ncbi:MAG: hypothetical protein JNM84_16615 [Planctomycetes bacterium]|nr:hypothetical protein [Planctomycetota bacterium]